VAVALLVFYGLVFALFTWQDTSGGLVTVPYTAFTEQVQAHNVAEVFARGDTIQGTLRQARSTPGRTDATTC
jgi:cell division protease FtsH